MLLLDAVRLVHQQQTGPAMMTEHRPTAVESVAGRRTDSRIDLTAIIAAGRNVRETLRHHSELISAPGYDVTLGLHRISLAIGNASQLFPTRNEDSEAVDFCNVLSTCMDRLMENLLAEKSWDADAVEGLGKGDFSCHRVSTSRGGTGSKSQSIHPHLRQVTQVWGQADQLFQEAKVVMGRTP